MKFYIGAPPDRKKKNVANALERHEGYLQMKAWIANGRAKPLESANLTLGPEDQKELDYKFPWRAVTDSLKRFIRSINLEADYSVKKYTTSTPGVWAVTVTYEPPMTKAQPHEEPTQTRSRRRKTA